MIKLEQVSYRVPNMDRAILDNVSLSINQGDFIVILGSNGSGKSSLLKTLNKTVKPQSGHIVREAKRIATLGQSIDHSTYASLTVAENCRMVSKKKLPEVAVTLQRFHPDLPHKLNTPTGRLSGGQRQGLALALCLLSEPDLLLLDEHTSALDPKIAKAIMEITASIEGVTIAMTTHSLDDALTHGNRLIVMRSGQIVLESKKEAITKQDLLKYYE